MARKKWCRTYKATTACTVRMLDKMGLKESENDLVDDPDQWYANQGKKRCVLVCFSRNSNGPIKTAHKYFPLEEMRWHLSHMKRGGTCGFEV